MLCRYMGISADAEVEEIKFAYRRLSKLYHPDSTQLPLEIAAQKFMRLKVRPFQILDMLYKIVLYCAFPYLNLYKQEEEKQWLVCHVQDAYDTLSNQELRNLYDNRLANKIVSNAEGSLYGYPISSQQGYDMRAQKRPERVDIDTLGGRNMPLSGQALSALAFDLFVLFMCISVILFVAFFKNHAST